ncbi:hypothetical protein YPPY13_0073, partial [Yersinia pestis PY-13]|jgi:hypothetical protein
MHH